MEEKPKLFIISEIFPLLKEEVKEELMKKGIIAPKGDKGCTI
jgi:hypothetical protein